MRGLFCSTRYAEAAGSWPDNFPQKPRIREHQTMKTGQPAIVGVVLGLLMAANAMAQNTPQMTIPWSVRQTAYGDDYYAGSQDGTSTSPADKAAPPAPTAKAAAPA